MSNASLAAYDEYAIRHKAAYVAHLSAYEDMHPKPAKVEARRDLVSLIIVLALAIVMIASIVVSSSRTIDEFGGGFIGGVAFVMVEGGIMAYAFFRARRNASIEKLENAVRLATVGLALTFVVGLGANMDAALKHKGIELPPWVNVGINVLVALSAPALAFISSDVLAIELMAGDIRRRDNDRKHEAAMLEWQEGANRSWVVRQRSFGVKIEIENPAVSNGIPLENNGILPAKSTLGHTKKADASKRVRDFFSENPEAVDWNPLEVAATLEVGKSTVYNVLKEMNSK